MQFLLQKYTKLHTHTHTHIQRERESYVNAQIKDKSTGRLVIE